MKNNWKLINLGDVIKLNYGKSLVSSKRQFGNVPVYSSAGITGFHNEALVPSKGIIIGRKGVVGSVFYSSIPFFCIDTAYYIEPSEDKYNLKYLYYSLKSLRLENLNEDTAVPGLNRNTALSQKFLFPPLFVQKQIASVLSTLDSKIELNNAINNNLEAQAQAIFKSWFVDYEPFKNGKFIDSELGKIPEGWEIKNLGNVCKCILGGTPSRSHSEYWNGNIPWINSGKINEFRIISASEFITELGLLKSATKLLPKKTTVIAITGATLGQVSLLEIDACANQSVVGVLENKTIPYEYIYPCILYNIHEIISHQTGGAQQHINKDNVETLNIIIPPKVILEKYKSIVGHLYAKITNSVFESRRLAQLRDALLPKLMSGEIDVSEVAV